MDAPSRFIKEVYVTERWLQGASDKERSVVSSHPVTVVTGEVMEKAADTATPQGILCVAKIPSYRRDDLFGLGSEKKPLLLVLEDIQDPGNLGTIFRTAEAAGATGILMSRDTADLFNPKTVRATMSAIFRMPFLVSTDLCEEVAALRRHGIKSYAAHLQGKRPYDALPLAGPAAFLIGNEGNGLSERLTESADEKIIIPMEGGAESLNAAMASGILLFEASRQRRAARKA